MPSSENADDKRAKDRKDSELPKCKKSSTDKDDPKRKQLLKDMADPK
jgi:hypothetical protein